MGIKEPLEPITYLKNLEDRSCLLAKNWWFSGQIFGFFKKQLKIVVSLYFRIGDLFVFDICCCVSESSILFVGSAHRVELTHLCWIWG
jgi:hypothetical protein